MIEQQFLKRSEFKEFHKMIEYLVLSTFNLTTRSISFNNLPSDSWGRHRCFWCSQSFLYVRDKRKYRYCSKKCSDKFWQKYGAINDFKRENILIRDKYRCQECFRLLIIVKDHKTIDLINPNDRPHLWKSKDIIIVEEFQDDYQIDHIKELASFKDSISQAKAFIDPDNLQTLCIDCHKKKTASFLSNHFRKHPKVKSKKLGVFL